MVFLMLTAVAHANFLAPTSQAIGFYSKGELKFADKMASESTHHIKLFLPRNRGFGTLMLINIAMEASSILNANFPAGERVQFGDMSNKDGGFLSGHNSHQNGLDVDVSYMRMDYREQDQFDIDGFDENFVIKNILSPNFDMERNLFIFKSLVSTNKVNRIFVDQVIKNAICEHVIKIGQRELYRETLRRLRHWPNHLNHFHLRLVCPSDSSKCEEQTPPPDGDGCFENYVQSYEALETSIAP